MRVRWEHFAHGADVGIRGRGRTLSEAFEAAAVALTAVVTDPARVRPLESVAIRCEAPSHDILLLDWLNALVFEMATRSMLFSRFEVQCGNGVLEATARGEPVDVGRHAPAVEVKGATLTGLEVHRTAPDEWLAQCIVDV